MSIAAKSLKEFIVIAKSGELGSRAVKDRWHRLARRALRVLAGHMGLDRSEYDLRTDKVVIAFPGETVLHSNLLYIRLGIPVVSSDIGFMYRRCDGREDFVGRGKLYMKWESFLDMEDTAARLVQHSKEA